MNIKVQYYFCVLDVCSMCSVDVNDDYHEWNLCLKWIMAFMALLVVVYDYINI